MPSSLILITPRLGKRQLKAHWLQVKTKTRCILQPFNPPCTQDFKLQLPTARERKNEP